ncbi:MAG: hypothetical protein DI498_07305 [Paracoccus denitrificans]|nr:MAG: hypothetical protein DI498_07305 [Paracoccus denitrificans]PZO84653.1 MAG: hypothetical protein DI633_07305 [Paracoccus denitrificans]
MYADILDLRAFYYQRALGRVAQKILRDRLLAAWPAKGASGMSVAGFGFAVPMLRPYLTSARRVTGLMPAQQGVLGWPAGLPNHAVLCDEGAWPMETGSIDRLVLLHALETSDNPAALLAEAWRVLGPGGRIMVMVPNRAGLWAQTDRTPFGFGRSYTKGQLESQARRAGFVIERTGAAIYIPPSDRRFWLKGAQMWERTGNRISQMLVAGVLLAELTKQVPAPIGRVPRAIVPSPLDVLEGITRPRPPSPKPAQPAVIVESG